MVMPKRKREEQIRKLISREYKLYNEEEKFASLRRTFYAKACNSAEKIIKVKPDKKSAQKMEETIEFAHLKVTPTGVSSLTILFLLVTMAPLLLLMTLPILKLPGLPLGYGALAIMLSLFFTYYIYSYPKRLRRRYRSEERRVGKECRSRW